MKTKIPLDVALLLAHTVMEELREGCERLEIAGSIRRGKDEIGDVELVAVPKFVIKRDMFNLSAGKRSLLDEIVSAKYHVVKGDQKYKQFVVEGVQVDLFVQPDPATWGVNFLIRTGCADFSKWMVTSRRQGGAMPSNMRIHEARLWCGEICLSTPEEEDVFNTMGIRYVEPAYRNCAYWNEVGRFARR